MNDLARATPPTEPEGYEEPVFDDDDKRRDDVDDLHRGPRDRNENTDINKEPRMPDNLLMREKLCVP